MHSQSIVIVQTWRNIDKKFHFVSPMRTQLNVSKRSTYYSTYLRVRSQILKSAKEASRVWTNFIVCRRGKNAGTRVYNKLGVCTGYWRLSYRYYMVDEPWEFSWKGRNDRYLRVTRSIGRNTVPNSFHVPADIEEYGRGILFPIDMSCCDIDIYRRHFYTSVLRQVPKDSLKLLNKLK